MDAANVLRYHLRGAGRSKKPALDARLRELGVKHRNVKKDPRKNFAIVTFDTEEHVEEAKKLLSGQKGKGGDEYRLEPIEIKRKSFEQLQAERMQNEATGETKAKSVREATEPMHELPYESQTQTKQYKMVRVLKRVVSRLVQAESRNSTETPLPQWLLDRPGKHQRVVQKKRRAAAQSSETAPERDGKRVKTEEGTSEATKTESKAEDEAKTENKDEAKQEAKQEETAPAQPSSTPSEDPADEEARHKGVGEMLHDTCCAVEAILPSPKITGYRNKCEYTIGHDEDGKVCVGFRLGGFRSGSVVVASGDECTTVPQCMKAFAKRLQSFLEQSSLPLFDMVKHTGFWRTVMIRSFESSSSLMALFTATRPAAEEEQNKVDEELARLVKHLTQNDDGSALLYDGIDPKSISVSFVREGSTFDIEPHKLLHGEPYIIERLADMEFAVSPDAFFQVNSSAAEVLYSKVREWALAPMAGTTAAEKPKTSTIFDVCCGTGTIGLSMARHFDTVVGVDSCASAIEDARKNAERNNLTNTCFVASMAEDVMTGFLSKYFTDKQADDELDEIKRKARAILREEGSEITAIVDPPRAGLHRRVVREIRSFAPIKRLIYISCNPTGSFVENAVALCRAEHKQRPGRPFRPVKAIPVDLFPHTEHCELVVLFERI